MITYIIIDGETYQTDTDEQVSRARTALRDAELIWGPVWVSPAESLEQIEEEGDPDSYKTGAKIFPADPCCESDVVTSVRCDAQATTRVEWMPVYLRANHETARNHGTYPLNGAVRLDVCADCAASIVEANDEWATKLENTLEAVLPATEEVKCDTCGDESNSAPDLKCGRALGVGASGEEDSAPYCQGTYRVRS